MYERGMRGGVKIRMVEEVRGGGTIEYIMSGGRGCGEG